jgi:dTDP-4-amino-4,6-dideoxygalactose transaminase
MQKINFWETDVGISDYKKQKKIFNINYPNEGEYVTLLESKIKKILKIKYCIALPSCTSALYISLKILNLKSTDEVIVPNITFAATANAVYMAGAKIILVDVDSKTLNIDIQDLKKKITKKTKVIIPVHVSGRGCDMKNIITLAKKNKIKIIEDAAEAFLSKKNNKYLGTIGDIGCYSLSPNKIFTSGQGGLLVTNNKKYYDKIRVFKTQGRIGVTNGGDDIHISPGGNFKLSNISAGLALSQLEKVNSRKKNLIKNYLNYKKKLKDLKQIKILDFDIKKN